jgi:hypothetical protein
VCGQTPLSWASPYVHVVLHNSSASTTTSYKLHLLLISLWTILQVSGMITYNTQLQTVSSASTYHVPSQLFIVELHEWKNIRTRDLELRLAAMDADETFLFDL